MRLGVDTSVLLRLFLKDDLDQLAEVRAMIERVAAADGVLYVAQAVLCELVDYRGAPVAQADIDEASAEGAAS